MSNQLIIIPRVSEKAVASGADNIYVFSVPLTANKQQVKAAVEAQFKVGVAKVHVMVAKGKPKKSSRGKRANPGIANRRDIKKAYVRLVEGDSLKIYDEEETK